MNPWYLGIALCLVDGFLCHELMKAWDAKEKQQANDPLTLEELREMDGEPVWVKVSENWRESGVKDGWRLVRLHKSDDRLRLYFYDTHFGPTFVAEQDYVQSWIAYRRKPEGGI